jgi:kumamolisin
MSAAFGVELALYEDTFDRGHGHEKRTRIYRGRDGYVYLPAPLHPLVIGVFGLDNRAVGKRAGNPEPPDTTTVSVATVAQLYNYPTSSATGQTIGILSFDGFQDNDIDLYFTGIGQPRPNIGQIGIDGAVNSGVADGETTQDIQFAAAFAPGAAINVYFFDWQVNGQMHWADVLTRVAHPDPSDVPCTVFSSSDYISDGDDPSGLDYGATLAMIAAVHMALEDCAIQGVTCCFASADYGTAAGLSDGEAHIGYPASDPWVLAVGGTTIGNVMGSSFDEYVWNDPQFGGWGTTGGGISRNFPVPDYRSAGAVPTAWRGSMACARSTRAASISSSTRAPSGSTSTRRGASASPTTSSSPARR